MFSIFKFSRKQKNGVLLLLSFVSIFIVLEKILKENTKKQNNPIVPLIIHQFADTLIVNPSIKGGAYRNKVDGLKHKISLFKFDPNRIRTQQWDALGVPAHVSVKISNYLLKGGRFKIKSDLLKIYGFDTSMYNMLKPYIDLPDCFNFNHCKSGVYNNSVKSLPQININISDSSSLEQLKGIGSILASRIIRYRNKLGGFCSVGQLLEVYGLRSETIQEIEKSLLIDSTQIRKININQCSKITLAQHPYIGYRNAKLIIAYRNQHGFFSNVKDILNIQEVDVKQIQKVLPYLIVQ